MKGKTEKEINFILLSIPTSLSYISKADTQRVYKDKKTIRCNCDGWDNNECQVMKKRNWGKDGCVCVCIRWHVLCVKYLQLFKKGSQMNETLRLREIL